MSRTIWIFVPCLIAGLYVAVSAGSEARGVESKPMPVGQSGASRVILPNVDHYAVAEPLFECVRVVLSYRGEKYSPAYLQGISGAAFRIGGPCPCAPTCEWAMSTDHLIHLLGYECERMGVPAEGPERGPAWQRMLARTKDEIRAGRPVILWHAFTLCENDVVCGFDEEKHELYGRGSYAAMRTADYAHANENRPLEATAECGGPHALFIGKKIGQLDARAAEINALKTAVLHAHGASASLKPPMPVGLECYDQWIAAYGKSVRAPSAELPPDSYLLDVLISTRRAAADFMRELSPKYPDAKAHLELAADCFARESAALEACQKALGDRKSISDEPRRRAAGHLSEARAMYALAISQIAAALREIAPGEWETSYRVS